LNPVDPLDENYASPLVDAAAPNPRRTVLRNTIFLSIGQIIGVPLSMLANAAEARYLGPAAFGSMYLGTTFNSFGFLVVEWGQGGVLPALVAADRAQAGSLLGTTVLWRLLAAAAMYPVLIILCHTLGYGYDVGVVISLLFIGYTVSAVTNAGQWTMVGFERAEVGAYRQILEQTAVLAIVVPILILGGRLHAALVGHAIVTVLMLVYVFYALRTVQIPRFSADVPTLRAILNRGTPFVFMSLAITLQPAIDATLMSKLASVEVVGWHSAARRLIGFLIFPASALIGALYPTLCRLHATDFDAFKRTTSVALRGTSLLVIPVALGCLLYPDIGIAFYDRRLFLQAEDNVRVLSVFVFLLYFTMPLGISILAAGKQRAWTFVQSSCVVVSLALDPLLVPFFQRRMGNGGLGVCIASVVSEVIVLICGVWLAPRGLFDRRFWRSLGPPLASGVAMAVAARLLHTVNSFVAAPVAVAVYGASLWLTGGIDDGLLLEVQRFFGSRLARLRRYQE
jgi:O-antigen/teichoic acid export membrane protein